MSLDKWVVKREKCEALEQAVAGNGAVTKKQALAIQAEVRDKNKAKDAALRHGKKGVEWCETDREKIADYVRVYGLNGAIRQWSADGNERTLSKGSAKRFYDGSVKLGEKPVAGKRGRPALLSEDEEKQLFRLLTVARVTGTAVTTNFVSNSARGLVKASAEPERLESANTLSADWARKLLNRRNWVLRKATTSFVETKAKEAEVFAECRAIIEGNDIPPELIINADHTSVPFLPVASNTYEVKGTKNVRVRHGQDKRCITALFAANAVGTKLPPQLIYTGRTKRVHPDTSDYNVEGWAFTQNSRHWATESTTLEWISDVLAPYRTKTLERLLLSEDTWSLLVIDKFCGQQTEVVRAKLAELKFRVVVIPAGFTGMLQPMDVAFNAQVKASLRSSFASWFQGKIAKLWKKARKKAKKHPTVHGTDADEENQIVELSQRINTGTKSIRDIHFGWLHTAFSAVDSRAIQDSFTTCGILPKAEGQENARQQKKTQ